MFTYYLWVSDFTKSRWEAKCYLFNYQTQYLNFYDKFHSLFIDLDHFRYLVYISFQIKSVKTGSMSWAIFTALSYFYMVSTCIWINIFVSSLLFRYFLLLIEKKNITWLDDTKVCHCSTIYHFQIKGKHWTGKIMIKYLYCSLLRNCSQYILLQLILHI